MEALYLFIQRYEYKQAIIYVRKVSCVIWFKWHI